MVLCSVGYAMAQGQAVSVAPMPVEQSELRDRRRAQVAAETRDLVELSMAAARGAVRAMDDPSLVPGDRLDRQIAMELGAGKEIRRQQDRMAMRRALDRIARQSERDRERGQRAWLSRLR